MRHAAAALALLAAAACTGGAARPKPVTFDPVALGGPCPRSSTAAGARDSTGAPWWAEASEPGVWLRVRSVDVATRPGEASEGDYEVVGGDAAERAKLPGTPEQVLVEPDVGTAVNDANDVGATVYAYVYPSRSAYPRVAWAVAFHGDDFVVLGRCGHDGATAYLKRRLDPGATRKVRALVGQPSKVVRYTIRGLDPWAPRVATRVADLPDSSRKWLREGWFELVAPKSFTGPYHVCTGIPEGWGDCVDLAKGERRARMWFPTRRAAEPVTVWLMPRDLDYRRPEARMAVASLEPARHAGLDPRRDRVVLRVTVRGTPSLEEAKYADDLVVRYVTWEYVEGAP